MDRTRTRCRFPNPHSILFCLLSLGLIVALQRRSPADDERNVTITGKVIDRETKQPIKSFRVVPGVLGAGLNVAWDFSASVLGLEGHYRVPCKFDRVAYVLRIEADGYEPATSREFLRSEENPTFDFELSKGSDVDGIVAMPDGRPAAGTKSSWTRRPARSGSSTIGLSMNQLCSACARVIARAIFICRRSRRAIGLSSCMNPAT